MKILIVGGWKKADFLTKSLLEKKHQVVIIHDDHSYCQFLARTYGVPVVCGDGSEPYILEEAEINGYDVVIALTPKDEDNLVICQLAKKQFNTHIVKLIATFLPNELQMVSSSLSTFLALN